MPKKGISSPKQKSEHNNRIYNSNNSKKFQPIQTILTVCTIFARKGYFPSTPETLEKSLVSVPNFIKIVTKCAQEFKLFVITGFITMCDKKKALPTLLKPF